MQKRFVTLWFRHLLTDWLALRKPELKGVPFVFATPDHGRMVITATTIEAELQGINVGMVAADAKAIVPSLQVVDDIPGKDLKLLSLLGEWCIRYTPFVTVDLPDGLILDISGCTHLWGDERSYLKEVVTRLRSKGFDVRGAMADTVGTAWAIARFGKVKPIIEPGEQAEALLSLPPEALRLDNRITERLQKLGLRNIRSFIHMQRSALRRRFGQQLLLRLDQALGNEQELLQPLQPIEAYSERLPCLEPIRTAIGIEIAIKQLLEMLCLRLKQDGKGLRTAILKCYRIDGELEQVSIGTSSATYHISHLFKLFELKIATITPALGIELFVMEASKTEDVPLVQEGLWAGSLGLEARAVTELIDRLAGKVGANAIHRYLPVAHYWPERSVKAVGTLQEKPQMSWKSDKPRPIWLLDKPERIEVTALIPDSPPMLFIYKSKVHQIRKADGPERIEREWWLENGEHRDYYSVEDAAGKRYWLFRSGHYSDDKSHQWFIHGFFA
ncbi:Y-family DNA polymerase [Pedobacter heparinus]|uniref:Cytosolic protein n=1 Tax=Pedobacter heparinus (strain ATCC 13125 / DSM 2366 / CIP 104194 / JCM 7457 / NBRC 12017 / NCIMB 9290 / NRRL B-14731 / HIM 762-3) TaxID=485917 RepID=C6XYX1_PEDHD|nr:DNA polymerase Y family protein [Pedobacter heparinus]ACU04603.1 cytosolic protein [Pedobacter heparinus DSM 2366]